MCDRDEGWHIYRNFERIVRSWRVSWRAEPGLFAARSPLGCGRRLWKVAQTLSVETPFVAIKTSLENKPVLYSVVSARWLIMEIKM